jgi:succinyl-diaminopimelate desuccinylase
MKTQIYNILSKLISYETSALSSTNISQAFDLISNELSWYPFIKSSYLKNGIKSVVWSTVKTKHPHIILNAHLDVVPAQPDMYKIKKMGDTWVGRGVMDMKFAIASYIVALKQLYLDQGSLPSLAIMITSDEEIGGTNGVRYLVDELGYSADVVLIPDGGSNWHLVQSSKGVLHLRVGSTGKTSHASEPWGGVSAIDILISGLTKLRSLYPTPSKSTVDTTVVIGTITGGNQTNQVSNHAMATLDIRYRANDNPNEILENMYSIFGKNNVEAIIRANPFICDPKNSHIQSWIKLIKTYQKGNVCINEYGASDGRYFCAKGMPVIISQPIGGDTHGESEYINSDSVVDYTNTIIKWLKNIS